MKINGFLLLDKPSGISSQQAVTRVKRCYGIKKAGHTGTLDPFATGLLPICLGEATKYADYFLQADKRYLATACLGAQSTTGDPDGYLVTCLDSMKPTKQAIEQVLISLLGHQPQIPPRFSAIKHQGKPLYDYARKGLKVLRKPRDIYIKQLELLAYQDNQIIIDVLCSKGTYIRSLVETFGSRLGCGAYTVALQRLYVGSLVEQKTYPLSELEDWFYHKNWDAMSRAVLTIDSVLGDIPIIRLTHQDQKIIQQGRTVYLSQPMIQGIMRLHTDQHQFLGLGFSDGIALRAHRLMAIDSINCE